MRPDSFNGQVYKTRLVSVDWLRGLAIVTVVFFHAMLFNADPAASSANESAPGLMNLILYFITWAGFFGMISGVGNTLSLYGSLKSGKLSRSAMLRSALFKGSIVLLINYLYLGIFTPGSLVPGAESIGVLTGFIRTGRIIPSSLDRMLFATALTMVGTGLIITGLTLFVLNGRQRSQNKWRAIWIMTILATFFVWTYPWVQPALRPLMAAPVQWTHLPIAVPISWLVGPMDPIFPYAGFVLYGAALAVMVVDNFKRSSILLYGYALGGIYTAIGVLMTRAWGFWTNSFDTPSIGPLIVILGPMLLLLTFCIHLMDFSSPRVKAFFVRRSRGLRAFGILSLTVFCLEGPVSAVLRFLVNLVRPGFASDPAFIFLIFAPLVVLIWGIILRIWARFRFAGSLEWFIIWVMNQLTGYRSERLSAERILSSDQAYFGAANLP
ncbi:MAG: hypothetical protein WAZ19_12000 [Anaerolineae bacterium]